MVTRSAVSLFLILCLLGAPAFSQAPALNFFNLVAIGDSLTAGFINGSLTSAGQQNSFVAHLTRHLRSFVFLPLIAEPGIPNELELVRPGFPPDIREKPGASSGRTAPLVLPTNLAVPGATLRSALRERPNLPIDSLADLILGIPSLVIPGSAPIASQVEMAEFLRPSVAIVWLGANDALGAALRGTPTLLTPLESFRSDYAEVIRRLRAAGANLIVLNVPDVTVIPALARVGTLAQAFGVPAPVLAARLGVTTSDFLILAHVQDFLAIATGRAPGPARDDQVLTAEEAAAIQRRIGEFNDVIRTVAIENRAIHVDIHAFLNDVASSGMVVGGKRLSTQLLGGIFSLDGIHPTFTGQALVANEVVNAVNRTLGLNIPPINVAAVMGADPLVF